MTVTTAVLTTQSPGFDGGDVIWVRTVSASDPVAGVKLPVKPAAVQVERAPDTDRPTRLGTTASTQPGGGGLGPIGMPATCPPRMVKFEVAPMVRMLPRMLPTIGVRKVNRQFSLTTTW